MLEVARVERSTEEADRSFLQRNDELIAARLRESRALAEIGARVAAADRPDFAADLRAAGAACRGGGVVLSYAVTENETVLFLIREGAGAALGFISLPLFIPDIVLGLSLMMLLGAASLPLSLAAVVLGHLLICVPFAVTVLIARIEGFDGNLEEASADLGEGPWMTFWRVSFPLMLPGIVASLLLTFITSFDEFLLAFFLSGTEATLPVYIWGQLRFPERLPLVLALGTLILTASVALVILAEYVRNLGARKAMVGA